VTILLLRHGSAGSRQTWADNDLLRPLDEDGEAQAARLPVAYAEHRVQRIVSSPARRCVETVEPLAAHLGLQVEERAELAEESSAEDARRLLSEVASQTVVVCTHRSVITDLIGAHRSCGKGSAWILEPDGDSFAATTYLKNG